MLKPEIQIGGAILFIFGGVAIAITTPLWLLAAFCIIFGIFVFLFTIPLVPWQALVSLFILSLIFGGFALWEYARWLIKFLG